MRSIPQWADQSAAKTAVLAQRKKLLQNENKQRIKQGEATPGCSAICSVDEIPDLDKALAENKLLVCQVLFALSLSKIKRCLA